MRHRGAFTFIELMVVMTIIAILAAIAIPNFLEASTRARIARSRAELATLKMATEAYRQEKKAWPPNRQPGVPGAWDLTVLTSPVPYLSSLPRDVMTEPDSRGKRPPNIKPIPYRFFNALQVEPERGLTIANSPNMLGGGYVTGLLWGYGPRSVTPEGQMNPPTRILYKAEVDLTFYDPSNGTASRGDIYLREP